MDVVLFTLFVHILTVENRLGWGWFRDSRYLVFGFACTTVYVISHFAKLGQLNKLVKFGVVVGFIIVTSVGVGGSYMQVRYTHGNFLGINDAGIQDEIAGRMLLLGKNPYTESYKDTELKDVPYQDSEGNTENPALYYYAHPPVNPILTALSYRVMAPLFHWYDIRLTLIGSLFVLLMLGYMKWGFTQPYLVYLAGVGCNPYFLRGVIEGSNDVFAFMFFVASVILLEGKKRWIMAAVCYGLAIGAKQTIWPTVPFVLFAIWKTYGKAYLFRFSGVTTAVLACIYGPFLLWNAQGLINGLLLFHAGNLPHNYPIHNFGFGMMLVQLGIIKNIYSYYSFSLWQGVGIVISGIILYKVFPKMKLGAFIMTSLTACLSVIFLFNRALNFSYLGIMEVAVLLTVVWSQTNSVKSKP